METSSLRAERTARLAGARLMLLFTPALTGSRDPLEVLDVLLDRVDAVQVRVKRGADVAGAREHLEWTRRVLELRRARTSNVLVLVNDRVDVARALRDEGCDGAHLGQDDCPPALAREVLGPDALLGLSTHDAGQVAAACEEPVDYLGFGPVFPTRTKGYAEGVGVERCWVAANAADRPVFAIGGIDARNASELAHVGRVAVSSALLGAEDPAATAELLRAALDDRD